MSLYFVLSIDGDWAEYFSSRLPVAERYPDKNTLCRLIRHEIYVTSGIKGKFLHFVHTSPTSRDFFTQPELIALWKEIQANGGSVGVHCHHESLFDQDHAVHQTKKRDAITSLTKKLTEHGLNPISYRGGYLSFSAEDIPFLEENGLCIDFSCDPGRHLVQNGTLFSDWQGAPTNYYRMAYEDHRTPGTSKVIEIPLGKTDTDSLYIDNVSLWSIWKCARDLAKRSKKETKPIIVSALTHTYEFSSFWKRLKIKLALAICKRYGAFISDREALKLAHA